MKKMNIFVGITNTKFITMKSFTRFLLLIVAILTTTFSLKAQVSLYSFSSSSGTYTPITGGLLLGDGLSDDQRFVDPSIPLGGFATTGPGIPIGFNFFYNGQSFDRIAIQNNGWISFGNSSLTPAVNMTSSSSYSPLSSTAAISPTLLRSRIAVYGRDLAANATSSLRVETIGTAPNRVCVIQWSNYRKYGALAENLNFQIRLTETSNVVQNVYGTFTAGSSGTGHCGLGGFTSADFNNRTTTTNWSATVAGTLNSSTVTASATVFPASGQTFTWTPPPYPTLAFSSITPSVVSCTTTSSRLVELNASIATGTITAVVLNYAFNGVAQTPIAMTNTGGTVYAATIPAATPVNANVTWNVVATSSFTTTASYTGTAYQDQGLLGLSSYATASNSTVCSGSSSNVTATLYSSSLAATSEPTYTNPSVSVPTSDEDFGNITISQGTNVLLNNTSAINSLVGTLGTATGTAGGYSNFASFASTNLTAGQTYNISLTSLTTAGPYTNYFAVFLDLNRNGLFNDAGEAVFVSPSSISGAHTVTGTFSVPASAFNGLTRMRVMNNESFAPSNVYINAISYGEYEDYLINMTGTIQGGGSATIPAITSVSWSDGTTVVGTGNPLTVNPLVTTTYTGTVTAAGCTVASSSITVAALVLPASPIATNSTQCGTQVPTASVASAAGLDGTGDYYWYNAATSGTIVQSSSWLTQYEDNFGGPTVSPNGLLTGVASLTATPGWLQLTSNVNSQQGGLTVQPGVNGIEYKIDFDFKSNTAFGADGFSWSFAPDADATLVNLVVPSTVPNAEMGTGSKLKISFDAYGSTMPNQKGTYVLYNNTDTIFTATSAGVLASSTSTPWLSTSSKHITITISQTGILNMSVGGVSLFSNIALPASYLTEDKSTWKHVFAARTGGVNMKNEIDNLLIRYKLTPVGSTTYNSVLAGDATFYVSELGVNGCLSTPSPISIAVSQPAPVTYTNSASTICIGESVTLNMSSTITPAYTYVVSSPNAGAGVATPVSGASHTFTPTASGAIPYIVTAANGNCTEVDTLIFNVVPGASPAPIIAMDTITICPSATSALFTATPSSMNVGYTFNLIDSYGDGWNGNALKVLFNGVLAQTLTFTTGLSFSSTINVPEGTVVTTEWTTGTWLNECSFNIVVSGSTVHTGVMTTAAAIASQMYSGTAPTYNYTFAWYSAATGGTLLGTGATLETIGTSVLPNLNTVGAYTVYAVQSNACVSPATPAIVNVTNVLAQIVPINASCNSVANGSFSVGTISCGTTPFTFSVDGGAYGAIPTNLAYGSHTVIVKDAVGAVAPVVSIFINQPTWITNVPNFVSNGWACKDATTETIAVANPNLSLTNTITLGNVSIGGNGVATLNPALNLPVGAVITGATLQLNGMTTAGGTWANDLTVVASGLGSTNQVPAGFTVTNVNFSYPLTSINPNGTAINVVITNTYGFGTAVINNVSLVVSYTIQQTLDNVTWYAAPAGGTSIGSGFTLESVGTPVLPTTFTPGTYNFYAQGELSGCSSFTRQLVTVVIQAPTIVANIQTATVCPGNFLTLNAAGGLTYTWSNGAGQNTPFVPAPTNYVGATQSYVVNGFDIDGCANQDTVVVTVLPQPILNAGVDQTICSGIPVILNASTTLQTATAVTSIVWSNSIPNNTQYVPTTTGVLTATATGANGCTTQDAVQITVLALPIVNAGNDFTVCTGLSATLTATGANTYAWNNNVSQAMPFYPTATQTYTVIGTGTNGCTGQDQVVVTISTGPTVTVIGNQVVCASAPVTLGAATTNSMGGFWTTSNGLGVISPNVSNGTVTYVPTTNDPAVVNFTYVASNACGNASQSTTVTVLPIPTVNAGPDIASCSGLPVTLSATSNGVISWNNSVANNVAFVPGSSATYTVTAVGANNCSNSDQMVLTVLALPDVNAGADQTICSGSTATLNAAGANSFVWNNGVVNSVAFAPTGTQTYTVTGTALNGCQSSDQVSVTVNATPVALVSVVDDVTIAASPAGMNYQWINCASGTDIPTATAAQFTATANGSYAVIVTSLQGCEDVSDCIDINSVGLDQINISDMNVFPNPTSGEVNVTMPENMSVDVQIFDAQGKLVAEQMNVTNNGKLNISNVTPGVYMVRLTAENAVQTFRVVKN